MIFDPTFLSGFTLVLIGFAGAFLVALWAALVVWTYRDSRARHRVTDWCIFWRQGW